MLSIREQEKALDRIVRRMEGVLITPTEPALTASQLLAERVPLVGSYGGEIVIVSDRVEVWEKNGVPVAVYTAGRYPEDAASLWDIAEEETNLHYGKLISFGFWECLDEESELPVPSFDLPQIWVSRCDGFAPEEVEE